MRDKEWIEVTKGHMAEFKVPQDKVDRFWSYLDYLESGTIKKHSEMDEEEEAGFKEADNYVNDMVHYLDGLITKKLVEEIKLLELKR